MVPVRLQLRNFLSYGESPEPLDFTGFHVACLSGGNGQGKSALLDAITWAIWGEARKSSDQRKPDEEILRIGQREMAVDLTFDLDGARYRVVRSYQQSASGKTSKPGLEFQVVDPESGAHQPLTGGSVRETQATIDARLGIDYETFINSTFLLQGRSDEFTKKKPTERKEILGKVLGLDRYDRLAAAASQRWSALRERASGLDAQVTRLTEALEPAGEWAEAREAVAAELDRHDARLAELAARDAELGQRIARLDAADREATQHREALADVAARRARAEAERGRVSERIEAADALVQTADAIEAAAARYEALRAERHAFDEKATLARGIADQLHEVGLQERDRRAASARELDKLAAELDRLDARIAEDEARVADRAQTEAALAEARRATERVAELDRVRGRRAEAEAALAGFRTRLAAEQARLEAQRDELRRRIREAQGAAAPDAGVQAGLARELDHARAADDALAAVKDEGADARAAVDAIEKRRQEIEADRAAAEARRQRVLDAQEDSCPTCGTRLTDEHRATVAAEYAADVARYDGQLATLADNRAARDAQLAELRADFKRHKTLADRLPELQRQQALAAAAAERAEAARAGLAADRQALAGLDERLAGDAFAPELRAQIRDAEVFLAAHPYPRDEHDRLLAVTGQRARLEKDLRAIDLAAGQLDQRRSARAAAAQALADARAADEAGAHLRELHARRDALAAQRDALGYDAAAHERASRELDGLAEAPARLARLLDARRNLAEWSERRTELSDVLRELATTAETRQASLDALAGSLAGRDAAHAERRELAETRAAADRARAEALARKGALDERLAGAEADRATLKARRAELREAKKERALYGHLRRAFGRNGIPSLIIEDTLPEIEDRANALLDRLTDGRTRVTLETLKDKKAGGTKETLDIRITDAQGVARAYETYSGGEAFRVNFALRIALSQMLAERSGRRIRTLVIDEGFGTQDEQGLQALVEAIRAIQDDFDKVLVITHLDEIKAAFPVRIEVVKRPVEGSTYEVLGV